MQTEGLTARYVKAISGMTLEKGLTLEKLTEQLASFATVYREGEALREVFENPSIDEADRQSVIMVLAKKLKVSKTCRNIMSLLVDKKRTRLLPELADELGRLLDRKSGVLRASVSSATELKKGQLKAIEKVLKEVKGVPVRIEPDVDPALLGGLVIEVEGTVYDGSVKRRLASIRELMLKEAQ